MLSYNNKLLLAEGALKSIDRILEHIYQNKGFAFGKNTIANLKIAQLPEPNKLQKTLTSHSTNDNHNH